MFKYHILQYESFGKYYSYSAFKLSLSKDKALLTPAFGMQSKLELPDGCEYPLWVGNINNFFCDEKNWTNFFHADWVLTSMLDLVCRCITGIISKQKIFKYI